MRKRQPRRLPPPDLQPMEERRLRTLENELATDHAVASMHEARRIIESTAFVTHEQRRVNAEWLRRHGG